MVIGAGWAGARAMTSTSGPGHLADERVRRPRVLRGSARAWSSTSSASGRRPACRRAPRRGTSSATALLSHGDTKQIMLIPASVEECYTMAMEAFDLAERFQTLVFVMSDLDLGDEHLDVADVRVSRPAAGSRQGARRRDAGAARRRGAATRTSTATASRTARFPATTCRRISRRGSGHNENGQYSERPDDYVNNMDRLARKFETARQHVPEAGGRSTTTAPRSASSATAPATGRSTRAAISCERESGVRDRLSAAARLSVHATSSRVHRPVRARLRRRAEPRRADARPDAARAARRSASRSCGACSTTAGCRSTRGR